MKLNPIETYEEVLAYGKKKANTSWWITILYGIMGGAFIGMGYLGAIQAKSLMDGKVEQVLATFIAGAIFPTGILFCVFLGGGLFTSDVLSAVPILDRKVKLYKAIPKWGLTLLGNLIGALIMAGIATLANFFTETEAGVARAGVLQHYITGKTDDMKWYAAFFSGILCNLLVAGSIWAASATKSAGAKVALLWFPITLFAFVGFEHIVANFFIFWSGIFNQGVAIPIDPKNPTHTKLVIDVWKFVWADLLFAMLGNWVAGAILLPVPYWIINKYNVKKAAEKKTDTDHDVDAPKPKSIKKIESTAPRKSTSPTQTVASKNTATSRSKK